MGPAYSIIDSYRDEMVSSMSAMVAIPAISPASNGAGESKRADLLEKLLEGMGFDVVRYDYYDSSNAARSSLVTRYGDSEKTIWVIAHIDTVSEGERSLWQREPFAATIEGDRIYGRGTNDDGQDVIAGIYALKALKESNAKLRHSMGLVLVADEENGSAYGMQKLLDEGIFKEKDMFVVPDWGDENGSVMEIAEKSLLWLRVTTKGRQVHASTPQLGVNAYRYSMRFMAAADKMLHEKYDREDAIFSPSTSTFEMTKHEKNVDSTNIIPGIDVSYIDCRVLPEYKVDDVVDDLKRLAASDEFKPAVITVEIVTRDDSSNPTTDTSEIVRIVREAVREIAKVEPKTVGIGGGTVAAYIRKRGMDAVVWSKKPDIAHQPNEYALISDIVVDAKVFMRLCME